MNIEDRLAFLEKEIARLREGEGVCINMIVDTRTRLTDANEFINEYIDHTDKVISIIKDKLDMIFYKVFPEAIEADDALERAMKGQKKKPEG